MQQRKDITSKCDCKEKRGESDVQSDDKDLYEKLKEVDPERAEKLHPNNVRKIARSLQVYETTGKTHTELLEEQKSKEGSSHLSKFFVLEI